MRNLIIVATLLLGGCATRTYVPVLSIELDKHFGGVTICDESGNPVVILNDVYKNFPGRRFHRAHEFVHVRQMKKDCRGFLAQYATDDRFRLKAEAEAMCGELHLGMSEGLDGRAGYTHLLVKLAQQFPDIPSSERASAIPCRPPPEVINVSR